MLPFLNFWMVGACVFVLLLFALSSVSVMIFESMYWRKPDQMCLFRLESGSGWGEETAVSSSWQAWRFSRGFC